jgi:hypothetical protein
MFFWQCPDYRVGTSRCDVPARKAGGTGAGSTGADGAALPTKGEAMLRAPVYAESERLFLPHRFANEKRRSKFFCLNIRRNWPQSIHATRWGDKPHYRPEFATPNQNQK